MNISFNPTLYANNTTKKENRNVNIYTWKPVLLLIIMLVVHSKRNVINKVV